jgi:hypothetical protein
MTSGCWNWKGSVRPDGYGKTTSQGKQFLAHRLTYCIYTGMSMDDERLVLHKCNNKRCCNPEHLYAGTQADNVRDAVEHGIKRGVPFGSWNIYSTGTRNPNAKLTLKQCLQIKGLLTKGKTVAEIKRRYGISHKPIYDIKHNRHWSTK